MPSPSLLEFEALLAPIPGDEPAGTSTSFTLRQELDEARKEDRPEDYDANDPRRPQQVKNADWQAIVRSCREALAGTSKDLMLAARVTEALTHDHGFAGLRDGIRLMHLMVEQCWERMHPSIADGDLEVRAAPFNWLDDPDRGARFPTAVRMTPIVAEHGIAISAFTWRQLQEGKASFAREAADQALNAASYETCKTVSEDLAQALEELNAVQAKLEEKLGQLAPAFSSLRPALVEGQTLLSMILQKKAPADAGGDDAAATAGEGGPGAEGGPEGEGAPQSRAATRESLYRRLRQIAGQLQTMEPHSPIPYLITKAIDLGGLPFPMLMRALIRDENVLAEMNRELGIKEAPPETPPPEQ